MKCLLKWKRTNFKLGLWEPSTKHETGRGHKPFAVAESEQAAAPERKHGPAETGAPLSPERKGSGYPAAPSLTGMEADQGKPGKSCLLFYFYLFIFHFRKPSDVAE